MGNTMRTLRTHSIIGPSVRDLFEDGKHDRKVVEASTARIVVASLNSKPNEGTERVIGLIESCHRISQMIEAIKASGGGSSSGQNAQVSSAVVDLNRRLGKYKWHPHVFGSMSAESHFRIHYPIVSVAFDQELGIEHFAVQWIVENLDAVHRIRRCRLQK